jgi:hypothetical protein
MLKPKKLNSMTTRIGKIGRLTKDRRHELGQHIENGSPPGLARSAFQRKQDLFEFSNRLLTKSRFH